MRKFFTYFNGMTHAQLRKQPMPPGVKTWDDVVGIAQALNMLPEFVPPPTNLSPDPNAPSPTPQPSASASESPVPRPSPLEFDEPDGSHALALQVIDGTVVTIHWKDDATTATVVYQLSDGNIPPGTFDVPYLENHERLVVEALQGYVDRHPIQPSPGASAVPAPSPAPSTKR